MSVRIRASVAAASLLCLLFLLAGCEVQESRADGAGGPKDPSTSERHEHRGDPHRGPQGESHEEEHVELASLMGDMQRHAAKLGYSIDGRNAPLAAFYLEEIEEIAHELRDIEEHDGIPIGATVRKIMDPTLPIMEDALAGGSWTEAWTAYEGLIDSCNRCHAATEHEFVKVLPARGDAPYAQQFKLDD